MSVKVNILLYKGVTMNKTFASKEQVRARFYKFVSFRNKFSLCLSLVILVCYYAFIASVGFFPEILGYRLGPSAVSLGIILGVFIIVLSIVSTGIYTLFANKYFDKEQAEVLEELDRVDLVKEMQNQK